MCCRRGHSWRGNRGRSRRFGSGLVLDSVSARASEGERSRPGINGTRGRRCIRGTYFGPPLIRWGRVRTAPIPVRRCNSVRPDRRRVSVCTKISAVPSPRVRNPKPRVRLNHLTCARSNGPAARTTTWVRAGGISAACLAVDVSIDRIRTACNPRSLCTTATTTRAPSRAT